ncbi:MAG: hypothetical protein MSH10_04265 [Pygmaiobacter massiliensis]|nr:hypothetical protein [Pygmaiobacter massiliensis]
MKKSKAFWLTFLAALALLIPLYAIIYLQAMLQNHTDSPAAASQSQVGVDKPSPEDWRNLFVCATGDEPLFFLVRFDPFQGRAAVTVLRPDTLLLNPGGGVTQLKSAWEYAGPGYAADRVADTLDLTVSHYLQLPKESLIELGEQIGPVRLNADTLQLAGASKIAPGEDAAALSAQNIADLIRLADLPLAQSAPFCGKVLALFLACGTDQLSQLIPQLLRSNTEGLSTSIFADEIYDYEHILGYFVLSPPKVESFCFDGIETEQGFELAETAPAQAAEYFT